MEKFNKYGYFTLVIALMVVLFINALPTFKSYSKEDKLSPWHGELAIHFERHFDKEVYFKDFATSLWAAFEYKLFNEGRSGMFVGSNEWLYTSEEIIAPENAKQNIKNNLAYIDSVNTYLKANGVDLFLVIVPSKSKIYHEYTDGFEIDPIHRNIYRSFEPLKKKVNIITLTDKFKESKNQQQLFLRTDTHWTPEGAELAAQSIANYINQSITFDTKNYFKNNKSDIIEHEGDLISYLPLEPWFSSWLPKKDALQKYELANIGEKIDNIDSLFGGETSVNTVLVGTSYSANQLWNFENFLKSALQQDVLNYAEEGEGPIVVMNRYIKGKDFKEEPPLVIIWEFPERMLTVNYESQKLTI